MSYGGEVFIGSGIREMRRRGRYKGVDSAWRSEWLRQGNISPTIPTVAWDNDTKPKSVLAMRRSS
jgi:hypothetical protein